MALPGLLYRIYQRRLLASIPPERVPRHMAVVMDGNRRWARAAGSPSRRGTGPVPTRFRSSSGGVRTWFYPHTQNCRLTGRPEGYGLHGWSIYENDDAPKWRATYIKLALRLGAATIASDQWSKNKNARNW